MMGAGALWLAFGGRFSPFFIPLMLAIGGVSGLVTAVVGRSRSIVFVPVVGAGFALLLGAVLALTFPFPRQSVEVTVIPPSHVIEVDGVEPPWASDRWSAFLLTRGRHKLRLAGPCFTSEAQAIDVGGGDDQSVTLTRDLKPAERWPISIAGKVVATGHLRVEFDQVGLVAELGELADICDRQATRPVISGDAAASFRTLYSVVGTLGEEGFRRLSVRFEPVNGEAPFTVPVTLPEASVGSAGTGAGRQEGREQAQLQAHLGLTPDRAVLALHVSPPASLGAALVNYRIVKAAYDEQRATVATPEDEALLVAQGLLIPEPLEPHDAEYDRLVAWAGKMSGPLPLKDGLPDKAAWSAQLTGLGEKLTRKSVQVVVGASTPYPALVTAMSLVSGTESAPTGIDVELAVGDGDAIEMASAFTDEVLMPLGNSEALANIFATSGFDDDVKRALADVVAGKPPANAVRRVAFDESEVETEGSGVDKGQIGKYVKARIKSVEACYEKELKLDPALKGRVVVRFVLTTQGRVGEVSIEQNTTGNDSVSACLQRLVKLWNFPIKPEEDATVTFPIVFSPGG